MPTISSQQSSSYFDAFGRIEVTFTKDVIAALRLNPAGVQIKCLGEKLPCVIYSSSMTSARIIANLHDALNETLKKANNAVSLRFSFDTPDRSEPLAFFVKAKTGGMKQFGKERPDLYLADLTFTQRPPDDLIMILGRMLETRVNSSRRKEARVPISPAVVKKLRIRTDKTSVAHGDHRWRAVVRDVSFSGCKLIVAAPLEGLEGETISVHMEFEEPEEQFGIPAVVRRTDSVAGHDELGVFGVEYEQKRIPMAYKLRINRAMSAPR
jgi:hypothetical protein